MRSRRAPQDEKLTQLRVERRRVAPALQEEIYRGTTGARSTTLLTWRSWATRLQRYAREVDKPSVDTGLRETDLFVAAEQSHAWVVAVRQPGYRPMRTRRWRGSPPW